MIRPDRILLVMLAAGRSARFGDVDKLTVELMGMPLGLHAALALADIDFLARVAILSDSALPLADHGYDVRINPAPERGLASSLRLGVAAAQELGAAAILVALADMPRITSDHVRAVMAASDSAHSVVASSDGTRAMPPALFAASHFRALANAEGDAGGRALIQGAVHVVAPAGQLIDIDTPDDLAALRALA